MPVETVSGPPASMSRVRLRHSNVSGVTLHGASRTFTAIQPVVAEPVSWTQGLG